MLYSLKDLNYNSNTIHVHMRNTYTNTGGLCCFRYEWFINFWLRSMATRGPETQFLKVFANHTTLTLAQRAAHVVMSKISVGRDPKNPTTSFNGQNPTLPPQWSNLNSFFFKILQFSGSSLPGMTSSTLQPHFLSGGLLWQMVIVISFAHARKTAPNDDSPGLLTWIVQSPTKLKDKI